MDHFMGEWRRGLAIQSNQSRWNPHDWFSNAPDALFWASVIGDWKAIEALSRFPCVPPKWACPDHAYFSLLGYFLRGESLDTHQHTVGFILTKKKQQPRLLLECLSALSALNASRFQNAWETYLDYYLKHERNKRQLNLLQSRNASFYAAAALHYGVQLEIPTRYTDYVVESLHD